jgi:multisubunit Na+/H+ antiporter MnhB subunit
LATELLLPNVIAFALCVGIPVLIYVWIRPYLEGTINDLLGMPEAARFYARSLALVIVLTALCPVAGPLIFFKGASPKKALQPHFMQYVWAIAGRLSVIFFDVSVYLLFFAVAVTILAAALGSRDWNTKAS